MSKWKILWSISFAQICTFLILSWMNEYFFSNETPCTFDKQNGIYFKRLSDWHFTILPYLDKHSQFISNKKYFLLHVYEVIILVSSLNILWYKNLRLKCSARADLNWINRERAKTGAWKNASKNRLLNYIWCNEKNCNQGQIFVGIPHYLDVDFFILYLWIG